jgi:ankyrin repeat protein
MNSVNFAYSWALHFLFQKYGQTALMLAANKGHWEVVKELVQAGVDTGKTNNVSFEMQVARSYLISVFSELEWRDGRRSGYYGGYQSLSVTSLSRC